jgi:hypothetical protein
MSSLSRRKFLQQSAIGATGLFTALYTGNSLAFVVRTQSRLVNKDQQAPASGEVNCEVSYHFSDDKAMLHFKHDSRDTRPVKIIVPVISPDTENITVRSDKAATISRGNIPLHISADQPLSAGKRVFNFVPGLEAIPFTISQNQVKIAIMA